MYSGIALATAGPPTDYQSVITHITDTMNTSSITTVLSYALPIAVGMVFLWWAV